MIERMSSQKRIAWVIRELKSFLAIVLGKVLLVAEDMNFVGRFKESPLVFPIVYKALALSILFVCFTLRKVWWLGFPRQRTIESFSAIGRHTEKFPVCHCDYVFSLLPFFAFREIGRIIGEDRLWALLFKRGAVATEHRPPAGLTIV